jgi:hypothetical protein
VVGAWLAGVHLYGRGQGAPRQSGGKPHRRAGQCPRRQQASTMSVSGDVTYLGAKLWFVLMYEIISSRDRFSSTYSRARVSLCDSQL